MSLLKRLCAFCLLVAAPLEAAELRYKEPFLAELVREVPGLLKTFDPETGRFGSGIWIVTDQNVMLALAVAYATAAPGNPYHKDPDLLNTLAKAGDALIEDMDANGQWVFRKKDGSTWGKIHMPWIYSRWVRAYALIRDDLPEPARRRWSQALTLGYGKIAASLGGPGKVHNIPTHHAMGLYSAGKVLDNPQWRQIASDYLIRAAKAQSEGGYWSEGEGPVVNYNFVYIDALGAYHAMSGDDRVLPALERAARFHLHFTYPGGACVETIDQRNPFESTVHSGNPGFSITSIGRGYLQRQWRHVEVSKFSADSLGLFLLHGQEGPVAEADPSGSADIFVLAEDGVQRAATIRKGPWFVCLSAYTAKVLQNRWIQDRQNLVSIWHDQVGLILGGGNTHLQPAWSTFTVGDMDLLRHKPGDEQPSFLPRGELYHVPSGARLALGTTPGLDLTYGPERCRVRIRFMDDRKIEYQVEATAASKLPMAAHLTLLPKLKQPLVTGHGHKLTLGNGRINLSPDAIYGSVSHAGWTLRLPEAAWVHWPALPHNPYRKDGRAGADEGRIEVRIPLTPEMPVQRVELEVLPR